MPIWRPAIMASPRARRGRPSQEPQPGSALAAQVEILHAAARKKRPARPISRSSRSPAGPTATCRSSAGSSQSSPAGRPRVLDAPAPQPANTSGTDETAIDRIDLKTLGPLVWAPRPAFSRTDTAGPWNLADKKGKNVLIFFLGGKCAHCMQQLQPFGKEYEALSNT